MSAIDDRIVSMKFDNAQFQKGAADTVKTLADLKKSLQFEGVAKGLQALDVSRIGDSVDQLKSKFEGLGTVVTGILLGLGAQITNFAVNSAKSLAGNLIKGAKDGFGEYETQINAVQTILSNTQSKGTSIDQVNAALEELNTYADKTIYNFSAMTQAIGTFTVAGVGLTEATAAVKGFSNVAALSGANATSAAGAMRQLALGISSGTIRLQDWMSIETAGIAGEQFQEALKTTARAHGVAVDEMIANNGSFRLSLQEDWLTADIMTQTLAALTGDLSEEQLRNQGYSAEQAAQLYAMAMAANASATEVKTLTQLIGTINEAIGSGWAKSWQIIFGDFVEAKALFTEINDIVGKMVQESADARNEQLQFWKDGDERGSGRTAAIDALRNAFEALMQIVTPIRNAFKDVFPPTLGKNLLNISFALKDFTERLKIGADGSAALYTIFKAVFTGLKFFVDLAGGAFRIFFDNISIGFQVLGALMGLLPPVVRFLANLATGGQVAENGIAGLVDKFIALRQELVGPIIKFLQRAGAALNEFLNGDPSRFADMWQQALEPIAELGDTIRQRWGMVVDFFAGVFAPIGARIADSWNNVRNAIEGVWKFLKPVAAAISEFFSGLGEGIADMFAGADWDTVLATINTGLLIGIVIAVRNAFKNITGIFSAAGKIGEGISNSLSALTGVLKAMQMDLKANALIKIAGAIGIMAISLAILATVDPNRLMQASIALGVIATAIIGILLIVDKMMQSADSVSSWTDTLKTSFTGLSDSVKNNLNAAALMKAAAALLLLAGAMVVMAFAITMLAGLSWEELSKGLLGVAVAMGLLVGAAVLMSKFENSIFKSAAAMVVMAAAIVAMAGAIAIFGNIPMDVLIQGGISVAIMLGALVGVAVLLNKFAPQMVLSAVGMLAMAAALNALIIPITALGLLPMQVLTQGMLAVTIMLFGLTVAANQIAGLGPKMAVAALSLIAMAIAINLLVIPIAALGAMGIDTLIQGLIGLAAALAIMVVAANAMQSAILGAGAMILMAGAMVIMAFAISILGSVPVEGIITALVALAAVFLIIGIAAYVLAPVIVIVLALAAAFLIIGVGMVLLAGAMFIFVAALAMLGPALMSAVTGLMAFVQQAGAILSAVPAMLAIGAALIVFGAGALVAGAGIAVLGIGLILLGAGLALVGAVGLIGATALAAVVKSMMKLIEHVPGMLIMAGTFTVLGAGVLVLGAGLLVLGAGALLTAAALSLLVPLGALVTIALNLVMSAIEKAAGKAASIEALAAAMGPLGTAIAKVGTSGAAASAGIFGASLAFVAMAAAALVASVAVVAMAAAFGISAGVIVATTLLISTSFSVMTVAVQSSITALIAGISAAVPAVTGNAARLVSSMNSTILGGLAASRGQMYSSGASIGQAIADGMTVGIQNGSYRVSSAARTVAANALQAAKNELGVASPSKKFTEVGEWMSEGQAIGVLKNMSMVTGATEKVGKAAVYTMQKSIAGIANAVAMDMDMTPTIRPVLDLSAVRQGSGLIGGMLTPPKLRLDNNYAMADSTSVALSRTDNPDEVTLGSTTPAAQSLTFIQNNYSPKAIAPAETYRGSRNLISRAKEELAKK